MICPTLRSTLMETYTFVYHVGSRPMYDLMNILHCTRILTALISFGNGSLFLQKQSAISVRGFFSIFLHHLKNFQNCWIIFFI